MSQALPAAVRWARAPALVLALVLAGCTGDDAAPESAPRSTAPEPSVSPPVGGPSEPEPEESTTPEPEPDAAAAIALVVELAGLGPREATSRAFHRAADIVEERLVVFGYPVSRQRFRVPAGESWGVPVEAGRTVNLVAQLPASAGDSAGSDVVVVGAHLDTVPQAPGAEDNASGVAVVLELARLAAASGTRRPVTFVLFGAEEPRGPADDEHHFGSQFYVEQVGDGLPAPAAMVSLDRVGARGQVPICTGGLSPSRVQRELLAAARALDIPARACENRTSDHWPFEKAGYPVARIGGNDAPGYHSPRDLPRDVSERQLDRVARVMWEWLR